jgi:hypothetical protein
MNTSGSYLNSDVTFLLSLIPDDRAQELGVESRVSGEYVPDAHYNSLFHQAVAANIERLTADVATLARLIDASKTGPITLVTLLRAGTPTGVLLKRALDYLGREVCHYSISAIRGVGVDAEALDYIRARHSAESILFVDGWTGKGFIATELEEAIAKYNQERNDNLSPQLAVLADLAGVAALSAHSDDYHIPFSMMLATICGLVSGAFPNPENDLFNASVFFVGLEKKDLTRSFIEEMIPHIEDHLDNTSVCGLNLIDEVRLRQARETSAAFVRASRLRYGVEQNSVKPGICEVNRALLTRSTPMLLVLKDESLLEAYPHVSKLMAGKPVQIDIWPDMPYQAAIMVLPD